MHVCGSGRRRLYTLSAGGWKHIHDWVKTYEQFGQARFDRLGAYLIDVQNKQPREEENGDDRQPYCRARDCGDRIFDAPRELVYRMWTEPEHLKIWWEPGTKTDYHPQSFGYRLGEVVRRATGKRISEVLRKRIAEPLGKTE